MPDLRQRKAMRSAIQEYHREARPRSILLIAVPLHASRAVMFVHTLPQSGCPKCELGRRPAAFAAVKKEMSWPASAKLPHPGTAPGRP